MQFLLVRHAQTLHNAEGRVQGQTDSPLSDLGRWQAERIADRLRAYRLGACFASDLGRATATARAIAAHHPHLTVETTPLLREMALGLFEGMRFPEIEASYPEEYVQWREGHDGFTPAGGESIHEQRARAAEAAGWLRERFADPDGAALVVSHGGILRSLVAVLLDLSVEQQFRLHFDNTSLTVVATTPRGLSLRLCNDTSHLGDRSPFP